MTNEDMAFAFANKNADKYINDEDPLGALRDGFLCGCQKKDQQFMEYLKKKKSDIYWAEPSLIDRNTKLDLLKEIINELFGGG